MHSNSLCTKSLTVQCYLDYIRVIGTTGIAQGGDLIDIYTQLCHIGKEKGVFLPSIEVVTQT
jgi:hypothetical protein